MTAVDIIGGIFDWVFSSDLVKVVVQIFKLAIKFLWSWLEAIFDPGALVSMGVRLVTVVVKFIEHLVPQALADQLDAFSGWLNGFWFHALVRVALWLGGQVCNASVVMFGFSILMGTVLLAWAIRAMFWGYHQFWGGE